MNINYIFHDQLNPPPLKKFSSFNCEQGKIRLLITYNSAIVPTSNQLRMNIFLYDIMYQESFTHILNYVNLMGTWEQRGNMCVICADGIHIENEYRVVSTQEGMNLSNNIRMPYFEISSTSGVGMNKMIWSCISWLCYMKNLIN